VWGSLARLRLYLPLPHISVFGCGWLRWKRIATGGKMAIFLKLFPCLNQKSQKSDYGLFCSFEKITRYLRLDIQGTLRSSLNFNSAQFLPCTLRDTLTFDQVLIHRENDEY